MQIAVTAEAASSLHEVGSADHDANGRLIVVPSYRLTDRFKTSLSLTALQEFDHDQKSSLGNAKWMLTHQPLKLTSNTQLVLSAGARLPTNVEDRRQNTYQGSALAEPSLLSDWSPAGFSFQTIYMLSLVKNAHQYDRNSAGGANTSYSLRHYLAVEKYVYKRIYLTLDGDYSYARTYQNSPRSLYSTGQALTYEGKGWSATAGHTTGGDAFKANGTDYNVRVFDRNHSVVFTNIRWVY